MTALAVPVPKGAPDMSFAEADAEVKQMEREVQRSTEVTKKMIANVNEIRGLTAAMKERISTCRRTQLLISSALQTEIQKKFSGQLPQATAGDSDAEGKGEVGSIISRFEKQKDRMSVTNGVIVVNFSWIDGTSAGDQEGGASRKRYVDSSGRLRLFVHSKLTVEDIIDMALDRLRIRDHPRNYEMHMLVDRNGGELRGPEAIHTDETLLFADECPLRKQKEVGSGCEFLICQRPQQVELGCRLLSILRQIPANHVCADCGAQMPLCMSLTYSALLCTECAIDHWHLSDYCTSQFLNGTHRNLLFFDQVRPIFFNPWTEEQLQLLVELGNGMVNTVYEHNLEKFDQSLKTRASESPEDRRNFIKAKWVDKLFVKPCFPENAQPIKADNRLDVIRASRALIKTVERGEIGKALCFLANSADLSVKGKEGETKGKTALHLACGKGMVALASLLLEHHADCMLRDAEDKTSLYHAELGNSALLREVLMPRQYGQVCGYVGSAQRYETGQDSDILANMTANEFWKMSEDIFRETSRRYTFENGRKVLNSGADPLSTMSLDKVSADVSSTSGTPYDSGLASLTDSQFMALAITVVDEMQCRQMEQQRQIVMHRSGASSAKDPLAELELEERYERVRDMQETELEAGEAERRANEPECVDEEEGMRVTAADKLKSFVRKDAVEEQLHILTTPGENLEDIAVANTSANVSRHGSRKDEKSSGTNVVEVEIFDENGVSAVNSSDNARDDGSRGVSAQDVADAVRKGSCSNFSSSESLHKAGAEENTTDEFTTTKERFLEIQTKIDVELGNVVQGLRQLSAAVKKGERESLRGLTNNVLMAVDPLVSLSGEAVDLLKPVDANSSKTIQSYNSSLSYNLIRLDEAANPTENTDRQERDITTINVQLLRRIKDIVNTVTETNPF
eukprot:Clim_evm20s145 gene=Clim_evmTU20s145